MPLQRIMQMTVHEHLPTHMGYNVAVESDLDLIRERYEAAQSAHAKVITLRRKRA